MKQLLSFCLFFLVSTTYAQKKEAEDPIDKALSKCMDKKDISNADMCNCVHTATASWDTELNKYFKLLMAELPKEAAETLKQSQKQWIVYRDKEFEFSTKYYYEVKQGTMWYAVLAEKKMDIVKNRTLELREYYETLEF